MKVLVIPSNREKYLQDFLAAWNGLGGWDEVVLVEDNPERTFKVAHDRPVRHFSHGKIGRILGDDKWIISRKDSACRCFGFLAAWWAGADYVLTLDDDCYPYHEAGHADIFGCHLAAMTERPVWESSVPGLRVRGIPYQNQGTMPPLAANVGLWAGHADLDARTTLEMEKRGERPGDFKPPAGTRVLAHGQLAPLCGMNLCISRRALPLFYFPLQGEGQVYSRFDDIWAGIIAKFCCDRLGWQIGVGEPFVRHVRASDPHKNLIAEAPGIEANEWFWEEVRNLFHHSTGSALKDAGEAISVMGYQLVRSDVPYVNQLGRALPVWERLFRCRPEGL